MLNNYAESGGGFNGNHGQTSRPAETSTKQHNIGSGWGYNSQLEGMYYGGEQAMYMGPPYDGSSKHTNYPQYPHQPVPTPVVKCQEACCQHFQDRYPLNPAPLRYQPTQPRYDDSRQYFTDRRTMQPTLSRKKAYPTDSAFPGMPDRHYSQFMGRGQFMSDSRQQMQMMRSQYPMYPPYWGGTRGYGPRMNCPPPSYHQSVSQGAQLQAGLKMTDTHYMEPAQKSLGTQRHRTVGPSAGSEIIRPVPEPKRSALDPNLQSCYEFGYPTGFVPFGEMNKIQGVGVPQNGGSCKIPSDKQYHPHQMQYSMQANDRTMMNCSNPINDLSYSMNFALPSGDPYLRAGLDDGQSLSDSRKTNLQYDSSLGKKRPDLDLRQYLATWEDDEEEGTRLSEPVTLGNGTTPYIVVDCRSLEGEAASKIQERFKTPSQNCSSKSRSSSPNGDKRSDEPTRPVDSSERSTLPTEFQNQSSFAPSMPNLLNESDKGVNFWNAPERDGEGIGKSSAFQPLDCSKRDNNLDHSKRDPQVQVEMPASKASSTNEPGNMSFDSLVSFYGDTRRATDGAYDFVDMTERLINNSDKSTGNSHQIPQTMTRPCDPRLQQSHAGNNPSIYNKVAPRYSASSFQHFKPPMPPDSYYNFKHSMNPSKYFGYDNSQIMDPNYEYHKIASEFDPTRLYSNKDATKDPRRLFHHELDKAVEGAFLDPVRKAQLNDCYQDKAPNEFANADPGQFISPIIVKKSDLSREKVYTDKNNSIRERMDIINNENPNLPEKTVLITSQNGPPEIFRVPYSPEKDLSNKDNVVTLHSGDQNKSNTITVEVPYVQQYSTLVKLSEEISRAEKVDGKSKSKLDESNSSNKLVGDETKKSTSFKLKRLPNSKEWAVENKGFNEPNKRITSENNSADLGKTSSCELLGGTDALKPTVSASNLNMPSLDDFREDESCDSNVENLTKNKINDAAGKTCNATVDDSNKNNKYSSQLPQMAIVQPMKLSKCDGSQLESERSCKLPLKDCKDSQLNKQISSANISNPNQNSFDPEKLISSSTSHLDLMPESEISKHGNFRTHKKIQSFSTRIPNCLPSPSEEFLHSQEIGTESQKEAFSPFHVYSDCDMNNQINDFFKLDERNNSSDKIMDSRMPSSPGVDGMFEDINHSNSNNTYQPKSCEFSDLTDPTVNSHNSHFQSFSTIFSDDSDRRERLDGSVLQMNDKKGLKNILSDMNNQALTAKTKISPEHEKSDDSKKSPPIPPISIKLKLNESKKVWCIANKNQPVCSNGLSAESRTLSQDTLDMDAASELEKDLAQAIDEEKRKSSENFFGEVPSYSEINQLLSSGLNEEHIPSSHIIASGNSGLPENILSEQNTSEYPKAAKRGVIFPENKCLTITKYLPRNKILERINSFQKIQSLPSKTLVFDQYGTHFPVIRDDTHEDAKSVAKDIIDDIISKLVNDKNLSEKSNIAHIPPFSGNTIVNNHIIGDEATINQDNNSQASQSVINFENLQNQKHVEVKENSIVQTTEIFIQNEKKFHQHHSVIKTVPSANNIVTKLRRPARSIFSPMSDHGKEDDEPIENTSDNKASSSQEDNLSFDHVKSSDHLNDCFDLGIIREDQGMDVDVSDPYAPTDENSQVDDLQILQTGGCGSCNDSLQVNRNQDVGKDGTEIDDALELMGLSNSNSVETTNLKFRDSGNVNTGYSLSCLQELSENESGIEEQAEDDCANSSIIKPKESEQETFTQNKQMKNLKCSEEENTSVESGVIGVDTPNSSTTCVFHGITSNLEENNHYINTETNEPVAERQTLNSDQLLPNKTNLDDSIVNEVSFVQSPCQISLVSESSKTMSDENVVAAALKNKNEISHCADSGYIESDENNDVETQNDEIESRLETSVIVRNNTYNNISPMNLTVKDTFSYHKESSHGNCTESVFNVRNIINEVINDAVSKDCSQNQYGLKNSLLYEPVQNSTSSLEDVRSFKRKQKEIDYNENAQDTFVGCQSKRNYLAYDSCQFSKLHSEEPKFLMNKTSSEMSNKAVLPLDLTSENVELGMLKKGVYCVTESVFLMDEGSFFVESAECSYFHDFKKRKWLRFCKSSTSKNYSVVKEDLICNQEGDCTASVNCSDLNLSKLFTTESEITLKTSEFEIDRQEEISSPPNTLPYPEKKLNDEISNGNTFKEHSKHLNDLNEDSTDQTANMVESVSEIQNDSLLKSGIETTDESQIQDSSIPLKDRVHFFNQKEHSFLRRDSLKLLEREVVLREIFSPDPDTDHSESKENECPGGNHSQHKQENRHKQVDYESNESDEASKQDYINDSEQNCGFLQTAHEVTTHIFSSPNTSHQTVHTESSQKPVQLPSGDDDGNNFAVKSSYSDCEFLEPHLQSTLDDSTSDLVEINSKESTSPHDRSYLSQLTTVVQDYVGHLNKPHSPKTITSPTPSINNFVERSLGVISHLPENENISEEVLCKDKPLDNLPEAENETRFKSPIESTEDNARRPGSSEESSFLSQDKEILLPDQQDEINEMTDCMDKTKAISYCHDSNVNDLTSKIIQRGNSDATSLVTGKDVFFSTTQTTDDQDDEALNSSLHLNESSDKDISYDEEERGDLSITSSQNDKINSVHDSLRNNQHMNKETFPLQCLVEAALALEHVDSKQILLNNSNFPGLYSQSDEGFVESPLSDSPSHENQEYVTKGNTTDVIIESTDKKKSLPNNLTLSDKEIFSKFEETNYNLRASTRIVTSSSSNIIPYSKRKYGLKSAKSPSISSEIKPKKTDTIASEKIKSKKRKNVFAYPRSKRRRKHIKDKQKFDVSVDSMNKNNCETPLDYKSTHDNIDKENILGNHGEVVEPCLHKEICSKDGNSHSSHFKPNSQLTNTSSHLVENETKNDFGGPLLIAGENTTSQGNIFCVHVESEKMDDYVSNLNVGGLGILSDNNHTLFKDNTTDGIGSDIPNVSLESGTSLVIIIEDLNENTGKIQYDDNCKSESDVMLGSVRDADCSDVLTTELSVNESCICPPDITMKGTCESEHISKLSYGRSDELLTTNCYEEINENLINDIGNWPFVEEEVAEFDNKCELPNKIPEEGRKIELKCSLPWKKIFNISKDMKEKNKYKKNKTLRKSSGLELGPAKVEVRLKAPSAEWKVIGDYHENSSPVVKVSRLILQRESDNSSSSYSEKDSEEENEHKKRFSECRDAKSQCSPNCDSFLTENISKNENWQPIVVLKRSKELDELTARLQPQTISGVSNSQSSSSDEENKTEETSEDSDSDSNDSNDDCRCSQSRESLSSTELFENKAGSDSSKSYYKSKFCETHEIDRVPYEKYSPTGCSNSLANEKIYSPSNPHFSPGEVYPDSEVNSDCEGDKASSNCDNADDVFLGETTHLTNTRSQETSVDGKLAETDYPRNDYANQLEEVSNSKSNNGPKNITKITSENVLKETPHELSAKGTPSNDYLVSDVNDTSPLKTPNSEGESENTAVDYKTSVSSNSSSTSNEIDSSSNVSREFLYDQTKKTKRKMPKNFFVRKKVRRNQGEMLSDNASSQAFDNKIFSSESMTANSSGNSSSSPSVAQIEPQSPKHSLSEENEHNFGSNLPLSCNNSRLHCSNNSEPSSLIRLNESSMPERFEEKSTLRNRGRGLKRPGEGHSREDTKRRRKKLRSLSNTCQECVVTFKNKVELTRHNAYKHARRRELHHCLLCQRSFSSAARHSLHVQGRSHQHLELTQRHTMHAMHRLLVGRDCPAVAPLSRAELRALQWRPCQPGYTHVYHDTAPLTAALRSEQSSELSEDTIISGEKSRDD